MRGLLQSRILYPALLILITCLIAISNFTPDTFVTGWDTLHPELNFGLNFDRLLNGVWRTEQGLGALAGHSHMADLPRVVILWIFDIFLVTSNIRYAYLFLCLILGPLGAFWLAQTLLPSAKRHPYIAFLCALFYLLNLSTVQQFYAPFEMFPTQWAALPWILHFSISYITSTTKSGQKAALAWFALTTLLATPQAYAAHLWYPFVAIYGLSMVCMSLALHENVHKNNVLAALKKPLMLGALTIVINGFWLFPNLYFIASGSQTPKESRQNRLYSQEYRIRNRENGYLSDVALMRGFYLNWSAYDFENNRFGSLMPQWQKHLSNPLVSGIGYVFFATVLYGIVQSIRRRQKQMLAMLPFIIVPCSLLLNRTPPFEQLFDLLLRLSLFEEASRFIFTKLSIVQLMGYTIFFAYALTTLPARLLKAKILPYFIGSLLLIYAFPMFQGQLIGEQFRIKIPTRYHEFWGYMKDQSDGRVLTLPLHTISGWQYYDWGYQGAGFLWFNLKQPLLDRDFDRWNVHNEQAFREFQHAVYSRRGDLFVQALNKYNIRYVVWDQSVITADPKNRKQTLFERETDEMVSMLVTNGDLVRDKRFGSLSVYTTRRLPIKTRVQAISSNVQPQYQWNWEDQAYAQLGDYISDAQVQTPFTYYYPLRNILSVTDRINDNLTLNQDNTRMQFQAEAGTYLPPALKSKDSVLYSQVLLERINESRVAYLFEPIIPGNITRPIRFETDVELVGDILESTINTTPFYTKLDDIHDGDIIALGQAYIYSSQPNVINQRLAELDFATLQIDVDQDGDALSLPTKRRVFTADQIVLGAGDRDAVQVVDGLQDPKARFRSSYTQIGSFLTMEDLPHNMGYIIGITARNVQGLPLRICLRNYYSETCNLYDELSRSEEFSTDYFIVPPTDDGIGYGLAMDNISFGRAPTINEVKEVVFIPLPVQYLSQIRYRQESDTTTSSPAFLIDNSSYHPGWSAYMLSPAVQQSPLAQAFPWLVGRALPQHVLVNNWQNGWLIPSDTVPVQQTEYVFVFWPQYLEYIGLFILIPTFAFLIFPTKHARRVKRHLLDRIRK